ncbi:MAG TPA: N,N-dimethylformamidase beta subunit family domain-containing protein, partial [Acetobacteraceae bacterium]
MSSTIPITGYLDRFSHRPGESFTAFVSANRPGPARARLLRVVCADPNPDGPGMRLEDMSRVFATEFPAEFQPVRLGSYGHAPAPRGEGARTWSVILWMGAPAEARAVICQADETASLVLRAGSAGLEAALAWPGGSASLSGSTPLAPLAWHRVWLGADPATGRLLLGHAPLEGTASVTEGTAPGLVLPSGGTMLFAAENPDAPCRHFNGKLEAPAILTGCLTDPVATAPLASWDFAIGIGTQDITDTGPQACHGELANMPTRAVVGSRWSGAEHCWRHAPGDYAAIHFHDDDLDDCRWAPSFGFTVPEGLKSGAYALHIANAEGEDWLPLYVLPKREGPFAPIAFLASTFTYQAYANHARGNIGEAGFRERIAEWRAYPHSPDEFHAYAHSTYNRHPDGSGVAFTSRLRPVLTMRPGFLTFPDAKGSGLRHYPADSHLLAWLEAKGFAFDVITDEDLDDEGESILAPYRVVLTGSHPEYHTTGTLDALQAYTQGGGRLVYLGGNGFYWRIARDKSRPGIFELRRAEGGIRAWQAEPGEYYHA